MPMQKSPIIMRLDPTTGLLDTAKQAPSPNCDARPASCDIDLLVIHNISLPPGEFGGSHIESLFLNALDPKAHPYFADICGMKVSAHLLIRRSGEIVQFVPLHLRAWHAGESCFEGRTACNDFSIGIELEGSDDHPYEPEQYAALAKVARTLMAAYPRITPQRIVGHSDIAPGRKTDPGPSFDWERLRSLL
jgi:N-acetyl-anhydromuramoyl-L-alanine amidase